MDDRCISNSAAQHIATWTSIVLHIINCVSAEIVVQTNLKVASTGNGYIKALLNFCVLVHTFASSTFNAGGNQGQEKLINNRRVNFPELGFVLSNIFGIYLWACFSV